MTAVELHELRTAFNRLSSQSRMNEEEWSRLKGQMEDKMREMQVLAAENERLFNQKLADMSSDLQEKEEKLSSLAHQHSSLKNASVESIQSLQKSLQDLQKSCDDLELQRKDLQEKLREAEVTDGLRQQAEGRVKELESAIAATRERAKEMIGALQKEKMEAESKNKSLSHDLDNAYEALSYEAGQRQQSDVEAGRLAVESARLSNLLEIERLINAPLRGTTYASTTLAHTMRSAASNIISSHSTHPSGPRYLTSTPVPMNSVGGSFENRNLTLLGRSWATTTPTAGLPIPAFEDNQDRFRPLYLSAEGEDARQVTATAGRGVGGGVLGAATVGRTTAPRNLQNTVGTSQLIASSPARSTSARSRPVAVTSAAAFLTPQKKTPGKGKGSPSPAGPSTGHRTLRY